MKKIIVFVIAVCALHIAAAQQVVVLKTGEKMSGVVQRLNDGTLEFLYKGSVLKLKVDELYSINFVEQANIAGGGSTAPTQREIGEKQIMAGSYMIRYKVADRTVAKAPKVDNLTQKKGTVVVEITIDKYGHVIKANPGAPGSSTTDEYLKTKAKQAAESALFDNVPTAPTEQSGYMIVVF